MFFFFCVIYILIYIFASFSIRSFYFAYLDISNVIILHYSIIYYYIIILFNIFNIKHNDDNTQEIIAFLLVLINSQNMRNIIIFIIIIFEYIETNIIKYNIIQYNILKQINIIININIFFISLHILNICSIILKNN